MKTIVILLLITAGQLSAQYKPDRQKKIETTIYKTIVYSSMAVTSYYLYCGTTEQNNKSMQNVAYGLTGFAFMFGARITIDIRMKNKYGHRL